MVTVLDIYKFIDSIAPFDTQVNFDNSGLLVGNFNGNVKKVLVCLDITKDVVYEAKGLGTNLIVSHHPVIFHPMKSLYSDTVPYLLAQNNINAICAHTNLDIAHGGVNDCLFDSIGLKNPCVLSFVDEHPLGLIGSLENQMSCPEFAKLLKSRLNCKFVQFTNISRKIKTVAVCSGAGGNLVSDAYKQNCDALVTGEIKHSDIIFANNHEISIFNVGHFKSENVIIPKLKKYLQQKFDMIEFVESECCDDKIDFI